MDRFRKTALVAGVLYLVTFLSSIPALFLLEPVLSNPDYVVGAGADTQVLFGGFLDLVNALAAIGTAVALYPVVRRQNETFALGFVAARCFEAAVVVIGVVCVMAVVTLRQAGVAAGADAASWVAAGRALVAVRDATFLLGPALIPGISALLLGYLMYRSGLVPRFIPTLGLIGGPLLITSAIGMMLGLHSLGSIWSVIATVPIFLWELILGLWMTFKGFRPSAITSEPILQVPEIAPAPAV